MIVASLQPARPTPRPSQGALGASCPSLLTLTSGPFGPYRLVRLIGEGGTARVFLAVHRLVGRQVALKLLRPEFARRRDVIGMLFAEARAANRIDHPNIAQVMDFVESAHAVYLVMEYIDGRTLGVELDHGPLDVPRALRIAFQVADALAAAHQAGVVHCDLKPDNILLRSDDDEVKLLDFGIAQRSEHDELVARLGLEPRRAGHVVGTPRYMSPEQAMGRDADGRSDVYALGLMLYEMITGSPPFLGTPEEELVCQVKTPAPRLRDAFFEEPRGILAEVDELIASCVAKSPEARVQDMRTLRSALYWLWIQAMDQAAEAIEPTDTTITVGALSDSAACFSELPSRAAEPLEPVGSAARSFTLPHADTQVCEPHPGRALGPAHPQRRSKRRRALLAGAFLLAFGLLPTDRPPTDARCQTYESELAAGPCAQPGLELEHVPTDIRRAIGRFLANAFDRL